MRVHPSRLVLVPTALLFLLLTLFACSTVKHQPVQFSATPSPHGEDPFPNWPSPPDAVETEIVEALAAGDFEEAASKRTERGMSGARKVTLRFPGSQKDITFKWKVIPEDLDNFNNSPRREVAAYEVQKLFLAPEDYVVPTSFLYCAPLDPYFKDDKSAEASIKGTSCVIGNLSLWLRDVTIPEVFFEEERFLNEPHYAHFMSNLNLLTYLIAHRDARVGNFLVSTDDRRRQAFSIDNGESFGSFPHNFFVQNWDVILVPSLRQDSIDRLRRIQREDLDSLGVVAQLQKDGSGMLVSVAPGLNLDPERGVRVHLGTVQFGLTRSEIDMVWERIEEVIADVDSGKIPVF